MMRLSFVLTALLMSPFAQAGTEEAQYFHNIQTNSHLLCSSSMLYFECGFHPWQWDVSS